MANISEIKTPDGVTHKIKDATARAEIALLANSGSKNMLNNVATSKTVNGVTFTVNNDGSVTINGTAAEQAVLNLTNDQRSIMTEVGTSYVASLYSGTSNIVMSLFNKNWGGIGKPVSDTVTFKEDTEGGRLARLTVNAGTTVDNLTVYPMVRNAEIQDETFQPYAPSNRELYEMILALQNP